MSDRRCTKEQTTLAIIDFVTMKLDHAEPLRRIIDELRDVWSEPEAVVSQEEVERLIVGVLCLRAKPSRIQEAP